MKLLLLDKRIITQLVASADFSCSKRMVVKGPVICGDDGLLFYWGFLLVISSIQIV